MARVVVDHLGGEETASVRLGVEGVQANVQERRCECRIVIAGAATGAAPPDA
jgi:hypothetical protein